MSKESIEMVDTDINVHGSIGLVGYRVIGRKSWLAYGGLLLRYLLIFSSIYFLDVKLSLEPNFNWVKDYSLYVYVYFIMMLFYRIAVLRSYKIAVTNEGIWLSFGIFPWAKGGNGLRWIDADMAFYYPNFLSWITNSYKITVNHKYTNKSDFMASNIWRGRKVCSEISVIQRSNLRV